MLVLARQVERDPMPGKEGGTKDETFSLGAVEVEPKRPAGHAELPHSGTRSPYPGRPIGTSLTMLLWPKRAARKSSA